MNMPNLLAKIMDSVCSQIISEIIGTSTVQPQIILIKHSGTIRFGLPLNNNESEFVAAMEFTRFCVLKELYEFACVVSPVRIIKEDLANSSIANLNRLFESGVHGLKMDENSLECIAITIETRTHVALRSLRLTRGFNEIIANASIYQDGSFCETKAELELIGFQMRDFFRGMKTDIIENSDTRAQFSSKLEQLKKLCKKI